MSIKISNRNPIIFLFFVCILSRVSTSIFHIEDIDSLRFALSLHEFSVLKLQPHFPGYPIFVAIAKFFYFITSSIGITFSIIGGLSLFVLIIYTLKLFHIELNSVSGLVCTSILFLNPFFWLMSNRYMPDLMGLSISIASLYLLTTSANRLRILLIGFFLVGILCGTRLSYLPLLTLPIIYHLYKNSKRHLLLLSFSIGCLLWFIPFVWVTGLDPLYAAAFKQTVGHFHDFGGTVITDGVWHQRIVSMIRSIWADGLGGYWTGRSWQTFFISISMVCSFYYGFLLLKKNGLNKKYTIVFISLIFYAIWVFFFQNIIYKSRHILPLIVFFIVIINFGISEIIKKHKLKGYIVFGIFILSLANVTFVLNSQHKRPNAISSIKDEILKMGDQYPIASIPLINYYLKNHGIKNQFIDIQSRESISLIKSLKSDSLLLIGDFKDYFLDEYYITHHSNYYHNPYMNRMWSHINTYRLDKKNEE